MPAKGFTTCGNKGFHMKFENDWAVSVQWGIGNYCTADDEARFGADFGVELNHEFWHSLTAECAVFDPTGTMVDLDGDQVEGFMTADQVADLIGAVKNGNFKEWNEARQTVAPGDTE